jgi:hypothetical protein
MFFFSPPPRMADMLSWHLKISHERILPHIFQSIIHDHEYAVEKKTPSHNRKLKKGVLLRLQSKNLPQPRIESETWNKEEDEFV